MMGAEPGKVKKRKSLLGGGCSLGQLQLLKNRLRGVHVRGTARCDDWVMV